MVIYRHIRIHILLYRDFHLITIPLNVTSPSLFLSVQFFVTSKSCYVSMYQTILFALSYGFIVFEILINNSLVNVQLKLFITIVYLFPSSSASLKVFRLYELNFLFFFLRNHFAWLRCSSESVTFLQY